MIKSYDFKNLFVFEMANNHQGSVEHGLRIVRECAAIARKHGVRAAVKLQFRHLDTFVHPDHLAKTDNKHIPRFLSTRLSDAEFRQLVEETRKNGLLAMATPFDEKSVDLAESLDLDIVKVGSCSARDWPLLEKVAQAGKPTIFSTGGLTVSDIDKLVSFFDHRGVDYAIMHCVSIYPIPDEKFNLNQIAMLRNRYPDVTIGWSTHEMPGDLLPVQLAVANGAEMFEKHVGVPTDKIKLNAYSAAPDQVDQWIGAYKRAKTLCGEFKRGEPSAVEEESIRSLARGVFLRSDVDAGAVLGSESVYFAMPCQPGQVTSGEWKEGLVTRKNLKTNRPILTEDVEWPVPPARLYIQSAVHEVKALLNEARVHLSSEFKVEYSHH